MKSFFHLLSLFISCVELVDCLWSTKSATKHACVPFDWIPCRISYSQLNERQTHRRDTTRESAKKMIYELLWQLTLSSILHCLDDVRQTFHCLRFLPIFFSLFYCANAVDCVWVCVETILRIETIYKLSFSSFAQWLDDETDKKYVNNWRLCSPLSRWTIEMTFEI